MRISGKVSMRVWQGNVSGGASHQPRDVGVTSWVRAAVEVELASVDAKLAKVVEAIEQVGVSQTTGETGGAHAGEHGRAVWCLAPRGSMSEDG